MFDQPDPYFCNQAKGRAYIDLAPHTPARTSSPYNTLAKQRVQTAVIALAAYSAETRQYTPESLHARAMELLKDAEDQVRDQMDRNTFLAEPEGLAETMIEPHAQAVRP